MNTIFIGYDLNKTGQNYEDLISAIKALSNGTWWHHLDSTWLIRTTLNCEQVRDALLLHIDSNDELLVINVTGREAAWYGFNKSGVDWINNHL